jgi:hypothetical protein
MTELVETLNRIANQADSAANTARYSPVGGTRVSYCEALGRAIEDLLDEIRNKLSPKEWSKPSEP